MRSSCSKNHISFFTDGFLAHFLALLLVWTQSNLSIYYVLNEAYAQDFQERKFTLCQQMSDLCKDDNTTIGKHRAKAFSLIASIEPKYESFTITMLKPPCLTYTELVSLLRGYEQHQNWFITNTSAHQLAFYGQKLGLQQYTLPPIKGYRVILMQIDMVSKSTIRTSITKISTTMDIPTPTNSQPMTTTNKVSCLVSTASKIVANDTD